MSNNESTKFCSSKQEHAIAYELGWDVVSGSGSRPVTPGDVIGDEWLGECKTHVSSGHPVTFYTDVWKKICDEAMMKHRSPALLVDDGSQNLDKTWVLCYGASIDKRDCLIVELSDFKKIRKNITFDHFKLTQYINQLRADLPDDVSDTYEYIILSAKWADTSVVLMPFKTFKEVHNK